MKDVALLIVGAVVGGFVGLAFSVYYQDQWKARISRRRRLRLSRKIELSRIEDDGPITIAGQPTDVYLVEGDGQIVLEPRDIKVKVRSSATDLPLIVATIRERTVGQLKSSKRNSPETISSWNSSELIALNRYRISRTPKNEDASIYLDTSRTDYATFVATVLSLDKEVESRNYSDRLVSTTLRREFFPTRSSIVDAVRQPIPFLANGIGVLLLAFTDDDKVILSRRGPQSRARPRERDVTVVEGLHASHDSRGTSGLNPYSTAIRGCEEELGVEVSEGDIELLAFAVDMKYYQWSFLGLVEIKHTADEVMALHKLHAKDRWEGKLEPTIADPLHIFGRLRQDGIWDLGLVTTYLALSRKCDVHSVRKAAEQIFGRPPSSPPWRRS